MPPSDQQQDLDIPSLRVDEGDRVKKHKERTISGASLPGATTQQQQLQQQQQPALTSVAAQAAAAAAITQGVSPAAGVSGSVHKDVSMSHIQGVKKALLHTNSFSGERLPKYGVDTTHEEELGKVRKRRAQTFFWFNFLFLWEDYVLKRN